MKPASDLLAEALENVNFSDFKVPLVGNTEASVMEKERIKELLTRQVMEPVRFYDSIARMQEAGVTEFIERLVQESSFWICKKIDKSVIFIKLKIKLV